MSYNIKGSILDEKNIPAMGIMTSGCIVKKMSLDDVNNYLDKYKEKSTHLLKYNEEV